MGLVVEILGLEFIGAEMLSDAQHLFFERNVTLGE